jgi:CxxC motif-containing protein (DUF1111 family)
MRRVIATLWMAAALAAVGFLQGCVEKTKPGDPLPGLSRDERDRFDKGKEVFGRVFTPETGLGPLFNANSCAECHEAPAIGGRGDEIELHATALLAGGVCDDLHDAGGPVYQQHVTQALHDALGIDAEPVPARATARGHRTTPDLFGFGLLDAIPEKEILSYADPDDRDKDGISGRAHRLPDGRIGRFGRKANTATLREFVAGAFLIEQGITSPAHPTEETVAGRPLPPGVDPTADPEIADRELDLVDAFVRFLAPPPPPQLDGLVIKGRAVFTRLRCGVCHVPVLKTGDSPVAALRDRKVAAYTDLLLHDMGPDLADICLGQASPSEFRTEPLMGLRFSATFLHDGRAKTIEEAVRLHGGEAAKASREFGALSDRDRQALVTFLGAL